MKFETKVIAFENPQLQEMLSQYLMDWGINPLSYSRPSTWVGKVDEQGSLFAAVGFTKTPDCSVVYVADILCQDNKQGTRAMLELMMELRDKLVADKRVQTVAAQAVYHNSTMRKFIERMGLRPVAVAYGVTREQYTKGIV